MKPLTIAYDLDGVVANFTSAYERLLVKHNDGVDLVPADRANHPPCWHWDVHYGYPKDVIEKVWDHIRNSASFWQNLEPLPGAREFLRRLYSLSPYGTHRFVAITDRPGRYAQDQSAMWIKNVLGMGRVMPAVILSADKGAVCRGIGADYYIDDRSSNIESVLYASPRTRVYLLETPYNKRDRLALQCRGAECIEHIHQFVPHIERRIAVEAV